MAVKKKRTVARWLSTNKPLIEGFLETRIKEEKLQDLMSITVPRWRFEANYSQTALSGRIVIVWNPLLSVITYLKMINVFYAVCITL